MMMNSEQANIKQLFERYLSGDITPDEEARMFQVIGKVSSEEELKEVIRDVLLKEEIPNKNVEFPLFEAFPKLVALEDDRYLGKRKKELNVAFTKYKAIAAAAVIILLMGVTALWYRDKMTHVKVAKVVDGRIMSAPMAGSDKAILKTADGKLIDLGKVKRGDEVAAKQLKIKIEEDGLVAVQTLAGEREKNTASWNELITPRGGQYQLILPDGTKVWMNSASILRFPSQFKGNDRRVFVEGEAFFEVAKDLNRPFQVDLEGGTSILVLGTAFNVSSYKEDAEMVTTLVEGSVRIGTASQAKLLKPGEQARITPANDAILIAPAEIGNVTAWKEGYFSFDGTTLVGVLRQLSRWYDVKVSYPATHSSMQIVGKIKRKSSLARVLEMLRHTGVNCQLINNTIVVSK